MIEILRARIAILLLAFLTLASSLAVAETPRYLGKPLTEALLDLQSRGLRLVFSSSVVRPDMMVEHEPSATDLRQVLDELLAPHGLEGREGESETLVVVPRSGDASVDLSSISGSVRSQVDSTPIASAIVRIIESGAEASSATDGSFLLPRIEAGIYTLLVVQRGFVVERLENVEVLVGRPTEVSFLLRPAPITEEELVITPSRVSIMREATGVFVLSRDELLALPHLGNDFYRALTLLPGVTSNDVSAQFHVRGARRDETLILLDGQELYDSFHLQDFDNALSIVTPETVANVDLTTGGYPVEFGDRMSGVLDMVTLSPKGPTRGRIGVGLWSAHAGGAGTFLHDQGGWIAELRRGTTDFAGDLVGSDAPKYWDAFGKLAYEINPKNNLRLDLLRTEDEYEIEEAIDGDFKSISTDYGSAYSWLTHQAILGTKTSLDTALSFSRIDRERNGLELEEDLQFVVRDVRAIDILGVRQAWNHQLLSKHLLNLGFEFRTFDSEYDYFSSLDPDATPPGSVTDPSSDTNTFRDLFEESHTSVYLADTWRPVQPLTLNLGLRYDQHTQTEEEVLSPRINLAYALGPSSVMRLAWGQFNQSQRPYELQVEDGESEFFPVERSQHWILGYERVFTKTDNLPGLAMRAEVYRRDVDNPRPRYESLFEPLNVFPEVEPDRIRIAPEHSRAEGLEIFLRGALGPKAGWWINYAYATTEDELSGKWIPRRYDQPHSFNLDFDFLVTTNWRLNLAWRYHTGWPTTPVTLREEANEEGEIELVPELGPLNSERLPVYHRLDLRATRYWNLSLGLLTFFVDIQNVYDRQNVAGFDIQVDQEVGALVALEEYWVGIFPSLGIILEFGGS